MFRKRQRQILKVEDRTQTHTLVPTPSDANVFVKTRKRRDGIEYKTDTAVMKYRIDKIEKAIG